MKIYNHQIGFLEYPDECALLLNISGCPNHCKGCHSSYLLDDVGDEISEKFLMGLIKKYDGVTLVGFQGGDAYPYLVNYFAGYVKKHFGLKTGFYSGRQELDKNIQLDNFDYIKLGPYIEELGGLDKEGTNQVLYKVENNKLIDIRK